MLWKKESQRPNALYFDFFPPNVQHWDFKVLLQNIHEKPHPTKSDAIALHKRTEGNKQFAEGALLDAMESYGDCLRFATPGSEHISLAYANRAACFLNLKMYNECLADIELAEKAGYPEHLMHKLEQRKTSCLGEMQQNPHLPEKLNFEPNEKIPYLSNVLMVQRNNSTGAYSVVAKTDIDVAQPIVIEDLYRVSIRNGYGIHCNICSKEYCNLVPCSKCAVAMFCAECQGHFLHEYECGLSFCGESESNRKAMADVRNVLLTMKLFRTVDELMTFVEKMLAKPKELPKTMLDDRSKYQAVFNCPFKKQGKTIAEWQSLIYPVYKTLMKIPYVSQMFQTVKHQRFLMHLIGHHNLHPVKIGGITSSDQRPVHLIQIMLSYFNYSRENNVLDYTCGGKSVWYTIKPINKGEPILFAFDPLGITTTKEQQILLWTDMSIKCEWSQCKSKLASPAQRQLMASDPVYHEIQSRIYYIHPLLFNSDMCKAMMNACVAFLRKFGRMHSCEELHLALQHFKIIYRIQLMTGRTDFNHPLFREVLLKLTEDLEWGTAPSNKS